MLRKITKKIDTGDNNGNFVDLFSSERAVGQAEGFNKYNSQVLLN